MKEEKESIIASQKKLDMEEIKLVGITERTSYKIEIENDANSKIGSTVERYFNDSFPEKIENRITPQITYCAYTDYESDEFGEYTYFIGEAVSSIPEELPEGMVALTIPAGNYSKITTNPGPMPQVVIDAWGEIWKMKPEDLDGQRTYDIDFEIYDERAQDMQNVVLDIYIGIA